MSPDERWQLSGNAAIAPSPRASSRTPTQPRYSRREEANRSARTRSQPLPPQSVLMSNSARSRFIPSRPWPVGCPVPSAVVGGE